EALEVNERFQSFFLGDLVFQARRDPSRILAEVDQSHELANRDEIPIGEVSVLAFEKVELECLPSYGRDAESFEIIVAVLRAFRLVEVDEVLEIKRFASPELKRIDKRPDRMRGEVSFSFDDQFQVTARIGSESCLPCECACRIGRVLGLFEFV